ESYVFRVQAVNIFGLSEESQESSPIAVEPALATPSAPYGITMLSCDGSSMTLAWKSPKHCGGSKVNAYYIDKRDADTLVWKEVNLAAVTERICTVDNLTEGIFYEFRIQAGNLAGVGLPSAPSAPMKCDAWTMEQPGTTEIVAGVDEENGDVFLSFEACEICETSKFVWSKNYKPIGDCPRATVSAKGRT
ncbi:hypothetical protein GOODEAATRI_024034, partial [Goodea atripinnis]